MKKVFASLAVLGFIGVTPVQAHKAEGVKCRARIVGVSYEPGDQWQEVETWTRIKNVSNKTLKPELDAGFYDLHGPSASDDEWLADVELLAHKLAPGESQRLHSLTNIDPSVSVDEIRIDHCDRAYNFDSPRASSVTR